MPQLKVSTYLKNDIMRKVDEVYKPHIYEAKVQGTVMTEMFYDIIVPEEGGLRQALNNFPACFVTHDDVFPFRGVYIASKTNGPRPKEYRHITGSAMHEFNVQFDSRRALPCQKFLPHCGMGESGKVDSTEPQWHPFLDMLDSHLANVAMAESRHKNAALAVEILLDRHKTVQPTLRGWPALWDLLPHAAQETIAGEGNGRVEGVPGNPRVVYDNPIPYSTPSNTFGDAAIANDMINSLHHLVTLLVTNKMNQRA